MQIVTAVYSFVVWPQQLDQDFIGDLFALLGSEVVNRVRAFFDFQFSSVRVVLLIWSLKGPSRLICSWQFFLSAIVRPPKTLAFVHLGHGFVDSKGGLIPCSSFFLSALCVFSPSDASIYDFSIAYSSLLKLTRALCLPMSQLWVVNRVLDLCENPFVK